jgi:hypothetical protein
MMVERTACLIQRIIIIIIIIIYFEVFRTSLLLLFYAWWKIENEKLFKMQSTNSTNDSPDPNLPKVSQQDTVNKALG